MQTCCAFFLQLHGTFTSHFMTLCACEAAYLLFFWESWNWFFGLAVRCGACWRPEKKESENVRCCELLLCCGTVISPPPPPACSRSGNKALACESPQPPPPLQWLRDGHNRFGTYCYRVLGNPPLPLCPVVSCPSRVSDLLSLLILCVHALSSCRRRLFLYFSSCPLYPARTLPALFSCVFPCFLLVRLNYVLLSLDSAVLPLLYCPCMLGFPSIQCCGSGSTGSTCFWASWIRILLSSCKNSKNNLDAYYFVTLLSLFYFLSLKNDVNIASKSDKQKKLC